MKELVDFISTVVVTILQMLLLIDIGIRYIVMTQTPAMPKWVELDDSEDRPI